MIPSTVRWVPAFLLAAVTGCGGGGGGGGGGEGDGERRAEAPSDSVARATATVGPDSRPAILFIGTSLTAGLGVDPDDAYPALIQRRLDSLRMAWRVINAGVSGETSAGAVRRLESVLTNSVRAVVLETGANDGLRGIDPTSTRANLEQIVRRIRARDSTIVIVVAGMEAPPNLGPRFTQQFRELFPAVAARERLALVPFLLAGVAGDEELNQDDGIHPTARGHELIADTVWRVLEPILRR